MHLKKVCAILTLLSRTPKRFNFLCLSTSLVPLYFLLCSPTIVISVSEEVRVLVQAEVERFLSAVLEGDFKFLRHLVSRTMFSQYVYNQHCFVQTK